METNLDKPWAIRNAIASLEETKRRCDSDSEGDRIIRAAMDYAVEVIKGINTIEPPKTLAPTEQLKSLGQTIVSAFNEGISDFIDRLKDWEERRETPFWPNRDFDY